MQDAWRAYLELALGLTEASRKKAQEVAKELVGRGEATASQVQSFVDEMLSTSRANREGLVRLVRYEVDRALGAVGLATADEVAELTGRLRELERRLNEVGYGGPAPAAATRSAGADQPTRQPEAHPGVARPAGTKQVAKKSVAKKSVARKAGAKQAAATRTVATKPAATKSAAKQPAAKRSAASKRAVPKSAG